MKPVKKPKTVKEPVKKPKTVKEPVKKPKTVKNPVKKPKIVKALKAPRKYKKGGMPEHSNNADVLQSRLLPKYIRSGKLQILPQSIMDDLLNVNKVGHTDTLRPEQLSNTVRYTRKEKPEYIDDPRLLSIFLTYNLAVKYIDNRDASKSYTIKLLKDLKILNDDTAIDKELGNVNNIIIKSKDNDVILTFLNNIKTKFIDPYLIEDGDGVKSTPQFKNRLLQMIEDKEAYKKNEEIKNTPDRHQMEMGEAYNFALYAKPTSGRLPDEKSKQPYRKPSMPSKPSKPSMPRPFHRVYYTFEDVPAKLNLGSVVEPARREYRVDRVEH